MFKIVPEHFYIHWPFCKNKCHYCDFVALEKHDNFQRAYHDALCREIDTFFSSRENKNKRHRIKTLFLGGGTPSLYPLDLLRDLFTKLSSYLDLSSAQEITLEVNPGGITREQVKVWRELGINRLSIGVQVLDETVLARLNRFQSNADVHELISYASDYFSNLSVDLILGLPGVSSETWEKTLNTIISWPITHVSVYFLTVHENTPLYHKVKKRMMRVKRDDEMVTLYTDVVTFLEDHGFSQYELSNFAKKGCASIHNTAYWERRSYKGFGLGAASFDEIYRTVNEKNLTTYIRQWSDKKEKDASVLGKSAPFLEKITEKQELFEKIMLGLRLKKGVDLHRMVYWCGLRTKDEFFSLIQPLEKRDLIVVNDNKIQLTVKGMALENEIILHLLSKED